jgi:ABC-2 type transport system permease protein
MVAGSGLGSHLDQLAVIALWGAFGVYLAVRGFSWEARRT